MMDSNSESQETRTGEVKMDKQLKLCYGTITVFFLLEGVEYSIILPTVWVFLQTLGGSSQHLGLVISAFHLSGLISSLIFGAYSDREKDQIKYIKRTKWMVLFANCFEIIGNILYFVSDDKWLLFGSRIIAGIGSGAASTMFAFLSRSSPTESRTSIFSLVMGARQVGLLLGPGLYLGLRHVSFNMGHLSVNDHNSPGMIMTILWIMMDILLLIAFRTPDHNIFVDNQVAKKSDPENDIVEDAESSDHITEESESPNVFKRICNNKIVKQFVRIPVLTVLLAQFITLFNQTALETLVTPFTEKYFEFGVFENSLIYMVGGIEVIIIFGIVHILSKKFEDCFILLGGVIICIVSVSMITIFLPQPFLVTSSLLAVFIICMFLQLLGLPFVAATQASLLTKYISNDIHGLGQGIRYVVGGIAAILGPILTGLLFDNLFILSGILLGLLLVLLTLLILAFGMCKQRICDNKQVACTSPHYGAFSGSELNEL